MSRRRARLRVPGVWRATAALALMIAPAGPALASSAVPECFNSELSAVSQAFDDVAPPGSVMRQEGDWLRNAPVIGGLLGGAVTRVLIDVADSHGFRWVCTTQSFALRASATPTETTATTTSSTMTTATTSAPPTTSITEHSVPPPTVNTMPAPILPAQATTSPTPTPRGSTGFAVTQGSPAPSTNQPLAPTDDATIDSLAEEGGDHSVPLPLAAPFVPLPLAAPPVPLPLAAPTPHHEGEAGRTAAIVTAVAGLIGAGGGILFGRRRQASTPMPKR